ncbi:MAG: DUF928 domain-containing protein [Dolichospermum sp. DET73]|nr:DUF928 domain-containing protein [Dolichospermum sp. DET73]
MMAKIICLLNKISNKKLTIFILTLVLSMISLELAWSTPQPQPQPVKNTPSRKNQQVKHTSEKKPTKDAYSGSAGVRGGCGKDREIEISLKVLGSRNYFGRIVSTHPTFVWFVPDSEPFTIKLMIYKLVPNKEPEHVGDVIELKSSPGIMQLSPFAKDKTGLEVGGTYRWQVVMECDPSSRSSDLVDVAYFEVVDIPVSLRQALDNSGDNLAKRVDLYAKAGFLQDALIEALKLAEKSRLGKLGADILNNLVQNEQPENIEELKPEDRKLIEKRIVDLKKIAASQQ